MPRPRPPRLLRLRSRTSGLEPGRGEVEHPADAPRLRDHHLRVGLGVWLRLTLTPPLVAFIMLSGFLLRGDADAQQALRILTEASAQVTGPVTTREGNPGEGDYEQQASLIAEIKKEISNDK